MEINLADLINVDDAEVAAVHVRQCDAGCHVVLIQCSFTRGAVAVDDYITMTAEQAAELGSRLIAQSNQMKLKRALENDDDDEDGKRAE